MKVDKAGQIKIKTFDINSMKLRLKINSLTPVRMTSRKLKKNKIQQSNSNRDSTKNAT